MKKQFISGAILLMFSISSFSQVLVWNNGEAQFGAFTADIDSITFGVPYQYISLNEVCCNDGKGNKWIEVYNKSKFDFNVEGMQLVKVGNNGSEETFYTFGNEMLKGRSYVVKAKGADFNTDIESSGDYKIILKSPEGLIVDSFTKTEAHKDGGSYSRIPDGLGEWKTVSECTKNNMNNYGAAEMPEYPITMIHGKVWDAESAVFPADEAIYLLTDEGQIVYDGMEPVYITAREYGEEFRDKYNAANDTTVTIEDVLRFDFDDVFYYEITFTNDMECIIWYGSIAAAGEVSVMRAKGKYTLDEEKGLIYKKEV